MIALNASNEANRPPTGKWLANIAGSMQKVDKA